MGDQIGQYTLKRPLGSGGFGEVWLADRRQPYQQVAIKVLKPGVGKDVAKLEQAVAQFASQRGRKPSTEELCDLLEISEHELRSIQSDRDTIARLGVESQALAMLSNPAIAMVHDSGTTEAGLPYLVMEYIEGKPLTTYCDEKAFTLEQRLELLARVADGVHHAHSNLLIHRDLHPGNILVTEVKRSAKALDKRDRLLVVREVEGDEVVLPQPKIVDFGLAKATNPSIRLTDKSLAVDLGTFLGSLEYMSPEQAGHGALEVDTRTDIFALGVILYELITGVVPLPRETLKGKVLNEIAELMRTTPRPAPSNRWSSVKPEQAEELARRRGGIPPERLRDTLRGRLHYLTDKALRLRKDHRFSSVTHRWAAIGHDLPPVGAAGSR